MEKGHEKASSAWTSVGSFDLLKAVFQISLSVVSDSVTPWTIAHQAPQSMGFSRHEYWSGFPFPSPGGLPDPGIEPGPPELEADALTSEPPGKPLTRLWGRVIFKYLKLSLNKSNYPVNLVLCTLTYST